MLYQEEIQILFQQFIFFFSISILYDFSMSVYSSVGHNHTFKKFAGTASLKGLSGEDSVVNEYTYTAYALTRQMEF